MKKNVVYAALVMVSLIVSSCQKRVKNVAEKSETRQRLRCLKIVWMGLTR